MREAESNSEEETCCGGDAESDLAAWGKASVDGFLVGSTPKMTFFDREALETGERHTNTDSQMDTGSFAEKTNRD